MAYTRAMFRAKSMKVDVSTELNCSAVKAWNEVQKSSLLLQAIWPLARIVSVDGRSFPERWTEGLTIQCRSYLFRFIPTGVRNLHFQRIDQINFEILTLENDPLVKSWTHAISIKPLGQDRSIYRARSRRDRARRHCIRARVEWRPDRDGECEGVVDPSRINHHACGSAPVARGLPFSLLRHWRRPYLLRA